MVAKKTGKRSLKVKKQTLRDLSARKKVKGGMLPETKYTYCGGDNCYKPNPY